MFKRSRHDKFGSLTSARKRKKDSAAVIVAPMPGEVTTKFGQKRWQLTAAHEAETTAKVKQLLDQMKIRALNNNLVPQRTGGIPLKEKTLLAYETHYQSLQYFFSHIRDYESLIMLLKEPLEYFPSFNPASIVLHAKWKSGKRGDPLLDENNNQVVDLDGNSILCVGTWNSPENLEQCRSAISTLHKARSMIGSYQKPCTDCIELDKSGQYSGCRFHRGSPKLWSSGNPNTAMEVYNWTVTYTKSKSDYRPNGDSPLMPDELRLLRDRLLVTNQLWDFELYTIILITCRMFLREFEVANFSFDSINHDITIVKSNDNIEGIAFEIEGKCDAVPVTLMMWFDHELPEFCPVRHLLAWLKMSGIREGFFFPDYNYLDKEITKNPKWDGSCDSRIAYADVLSAWKNLCGQLLDREGKFGSHSGRKTAYLFGVWGGAEDSDLMLCARHKTLKNALTYKRDAAFLLALAKENMPDFHLRTPKWKSLYCENHQLARVVNTACRAFFKPLDQLATIFVEDKLGFKKCNLVKQTRAIGQKLLSYSHEYGVIGMRIASLHGKIVAELHNHEDHRNSCEENVENDESHQTVGRQLCGKGQTTVNGKKKRGGTWDHTDRKNIGSIKDNHEKIKCIVAIHAAAATENVSPPNMTEQCRVFFKDCANPIALCLTNHCNGDINAFVQRHQKSGKIAHSKFRTICNGKGPTC